MKLTGYLELDGSITKISSVDELKNFVERLGKEFKELSASEYVELCKDVTGESPFWDDCNILYSNDGRRLVNASCISGDYKIKEGTIAICNSAFKPSQSWMCGVYRVSIPDSVLAIGNNAFADCTNLTVLKQSANLHYIGANAFCNCRNLKTFDIPQTLKFIGANAFKSCRGLTSIDLNDGIRVIGSHAFYDCIYLEVVSMPSSVEAIGSGVFDGCPELREIRIPRGTFEKFSALLPFITDKFVEVDYAQ